MRFEWLLEQRIRISKRNKKRKNAFELETIEEIIRSILNLGGPCCVLFR